MWKKIIIGSIFVLILFIPQSSYAQIPAWWCGPDYVQETVFTECGNLVTSHAGTSSLYAFRSLGGIYSSHAEATAAANLYSTTTASYSISTFCPGGCGSWPNSFSMIARRVTQDCGGGKTAAFDRAFFYRQTQGTCAEINDPTQPFESENFLFRLTSVCKDSNGNITAESYEFRDLDTGEQKFSTYGDTSTCDEIEIYANSPWYTSALFETDPSEPFVLGSPTDILGSITQDINQSNETLSTGDDTGVDDSGLLQNIATNTKINATNQQIISDQLTAQGNYQIKLGNEQKVLLAAIASATGGTGTRLDITNSLLNQIKDGLGSGGGEGAGAVEIGEAVGDELTESTEFTGQTGDEWGVIRGQLEAYRTELGIPLESEYYQEGDINTPADFTARMEGLLQDTESGSLFQGVKTFLTTSRITASGSCSASVSLWGNNIDLTVCGLSGALEIFGQILIGLATIAAVLIAFRG